MNNTSDPVLARIEQAERMLQQARDQHRKGYGDEVVEFLNSASRHIGKAQDALKNTASVADLLASREKGRIEAQHRRQEVTHAR